MIIVASLFCSEEIDWTDGVHGVLPTAKPLLVVERTRQIGLCVGASDMRVDMGLDRRTLQSIWLQVGADAAEAVAKRRRRQPDHRPGGD